LQILMRYLPIFRVPDLASILKGAQIYAQTMSFK